MSRCVRKTMVQHWKVWDGGPVPGLSPEPDGRSSFVGCKGKVYVSPGDVIVFACGGTLPCEAWHPTQFQRIYEELP